MQVVTPPLPAGDDAAERVVLRDGSVATLRPSRAGDAAALKQFFRSLSPESRRRRFFMPSEPSDALIGRLCDSTDPARALTLLAIRIVDGEARPVAVGSYLSEGPAVAEVAFAVDDRFHGRGLGTVLLERLAASAIAHGFRRFEATTLAENAAMLEVFRESGFEVRSRPESGTIAVRLSLAATAETVASEDRRNRLPRSRRSNHFSSHRRSRWWALRVTRAASAGACSKRCARAGIVGPFIRSTRTRPTSTACRVTRTCARRRPESTLP